MASERYRYERVHWVPTSLSGPRAARTPAWVEAYVPAPLMKQEWRFSAASTAALADAQAAVERAEQHAGLVGLGTIARQLLRSEAMASSQIEGVAVPGHRALAKQEIGERHRPGAIAAMANIDAVTGAYAWAQRSEPWSIDAITAVHRRIAAADRHIAHHAGTIRAQQNWIGTNPNTPVGADFIPPPAQYVRPLLDDLCAFLNRRDLPPIAQAAIAHVQFETIHPFADGNGRVGRALLGASLVHGDLCRQVLPPVSLVLARDKQRYVDALMSFRAGADGDDALYLLIAEACERSANASIRLSEQVRALQAQWRTTVRPRANSAAALIIDALPTEPMLDVARAAASIGRSDEAARLALQALADAGVLQPVTVARGRRVYECVGLFALVDDMERELSGGAIAAADTLGA